MHRTVLLAISIGSAAMLLLFQEFGAAAAARRGRYSTPANGTSDSWDARPTPSVQPPSAPDPQSQSVPNPGPLKSVRVARSERSSPGRRLNDMRPATATIEGLLSAVCGTATIVANNARQFMLDGGGASLDAARGQLGPVKDLGRTALLAISTHSDRDGAGGSAKPTLPPELELLSSRIHDVLAVYSEQHLNTAQHGPWEVMHRMVAFGIPTEIRRDGPDGQRVNAIGWLLWGGRCNGQPLLVLSDGHPIGRVGPGVQGHPAQFLGMLAQSGVSASSPFQLEGKPFTVADLIEQEKLDCSTHMELTFKLIALSYYLQSDETWTSHDGQKWSISRLIQEELRQPVRSGACGGTHRLFGLSSAYLYRAKRGQPIDGEFERAKTFIRDYQRYSLHTLQNPDGSFSTEWFNRPANATDPARKLQTTGHILEWLVFSLPEDELRDPRIIKSVDYIATTLAESPNHDWSVGPLGHALHALAIYDKRLHSAGTNASKEQFAKREPVHAAMTPREGSVAPSASHAGSRAADRADPPAAAAHAVFPNPKTDMPMEDGPALAPSR